MNKLLLTALLLGLPVMGSAMERLSGWCEVGAKVVVAPSVPGGPPISRSFQQSYPVCTVTVFMTGTATKAVIFSTNNPTPTPLPNPFLANSFGYFDFYSANGHYDVQISGGGLPAPFTFGDQYLFDIADYNPCPGCILSATGFISTGGVYNDYSTQTGGALFRAQNIIQTADGRSGGYIKMSPLTYNPNNGPPVFDIYGNPVRDPIYLPGDSLGAHDAVLFVAEATDLIPNPDLIFGIFTNQYMFSRVGFATDYASEASFQSLNGGMQALSFAAVNYVNSGQHAGTPPPLTNLDQFHPGAIFYDTIAGCEKVYNGTTWSCMGSGGGGGGTPGGPTTSVQFNNAGIFGGTTDMTWDAGLKLFNVNAIDAAHAGINVHTGFIQSDAGFTVGVGTTYNAVQAVLGGMTAKSFTASRYVQTGFSAGTPALTTGDAFHAGAMFYDTVNACESVYNGSGWACLGGGGGGGTPGGPNTSIQYNALGTFVGNSRLTWDGGQFLNVVAPNSTSAGINVQTGFIQSDKGFVAVPATATAYTSVSALGGGMAAGSFTATNYIQSGNHNGIPSVTGGDTFNAGALFWDTAANVEKVYNGTSWQSLTGGGGTPGGATTNVQYNLAGVFTGDANFTWNASTKLLNVVATSTAVAGINVQNGFVQSDAGFVSTFTKYNTLNIVSGGAAAKSFTATSYIQTGFGPTDPGTGLNPLTVGDSLNPGTMYWNTGSGQMLVYNGTAFVALGGGGGSPGGPTNAVQFNVSGTFSGTSNFTWNGLVLSVTGGGTFQNLTTAGGTSLISSGCSGSGNHCFENTNQNFFATGTGRVEASQLSIGGATTITTARAGLFNNVTVASGNTLTLTGANIVAPSGTVLNGTLTCPVGIGSGWIDSITVSQGLVTGATCR